ncbi:MAG TPA: response regulator [Verrucomicrobiae bacterium]|nr:response regulator [Verrucomicrobiae bacterium]
MNKEDLDPRPETPREAVGESTGCFVVEERAGVFAFVQSNAAFEAHFQIPAGGARDRTAVAAMVPGDVGKDIERCCREVLQKHRSISRRMSVPGPGGDRCLLVAFSPVIGESGAWARIEGASVDVTDLARAEAYISTAEGFDRYLIHATDRFYEPVLICEVVEETPMVVYANKSFQRTFGYTRPELVGRDPVYLLFPGTTATIREVIASSWKNQRPVWKITDAVRRDSVPLRCKVVFDFHRFEKGAQSQLKITFIPLEGQPAAVEQEAGPGQYRRLQLQGMLQAAGSIINDFNNLLAVIIGNAPLLPAQVQDNIESIKTSKRLATQAADIVINLLRMTRRLPTMRDLGMPGGEPPPPPPPPPQSGAAMAHPVDRAIQSAPSMDTALAARELTGPGPSDTVPAADVLPTDRAQPQEEVRAPSTGETPKILVVDDEPFIRSMIDRSLSVVGYRTAQAASGEDALAILEGERDGYDVVIMDYALGGLSGLEVLQVMRKHGLTTPVLMISGYLGPQVTEQTLALGRVKVLTKPFQPNELLEMVEMMVKTLS